MAYNNSQWMGRFFVFGKKNRTKVNCFVDFPLFFLVHFDATVDGCYRSSSSSGSSLSFLSAVSKVLTGDALFTVSSSSFLIHDWWIRSCQLRAQYQQFFLVFLFLSTHIFASKEKLPLLSIGACGGGRRVGAGQKGRAKLFTKTLQPQHGMPFLSEVRDTEADHSG